MSELIRMLTQQGLATPLQIVVVAIDGYLVVAERMTGFLLLSVIIIASTFVLQTVRPRFLLLYPRNGFLPGDTSNLDTYYLRLVLVAATLLAVLALFSGFNNSAQWAWKYDESSMSLWVIVVAASVVFIAIAPLVFWFNSDRLSDSIAKKLRDEGAWSMVRPCPFCNKGYAVETHTVVDRNNGITHLDCGECGKVEDRNISLNIGEVG